MKTKLGLSLLSVAIAVLLTVGIDRCVGFVRTPVANLIFEPYLTVRYNSPEFHVEARINNLGFRGPDFDLERSERYRVLALGDSFTFGFGVGNEDTWPALLAAELRTWNGGVEVANLGKPGSAPADYADVAERAIPVLKPDLVVIGLLQGDDLGQAMRTPRLPKDPGPAESRNLRVSSSRFLRQVMYPNLTARLVVGHSEPIQIDAVWKKSVDRLMKGLNKAQKKRLDAVDKEILDIFVAGELNPGLLLLGIKHPEHFSKTLDLDQRAVQKGIEEIGVHLSRIKIAARRHGGRVVVVSIPMGAFASRRNLDNYVRMGIKMSPSYLETNKMDEALRQAAAAADVEFLEITKVFREAATERSLYFELDGHPNAEGQYLLAATIAPFVQDKLSSLAR